MTGTDPSPRYPLIRIISIAVAALALALAVTGVVTGASVLAWVVATMALTTFGASYYVKNN